jgi:large subunit ribosomal protein L20
MPRVKSSPQTRKRRKKILKLAKGYFGSKRTLYRTAHEQVMRSLTYAYRDRRQTKRNFRKLWISRINAAAAQNGFKYSRFMYGLKLAGVQVNRKILADLAVNEPKVFTHYVDLAKKAISNPTQYQVKTEAPKVVANGNTIAPIQKEVKTATKQAAIDFASLKVAELRELAKDKNISNYSSMKKAELIEALESVSK